MVGDLQTKPKYRCYFYSRQYRVNISSKHLFKTSILVPEMTVIASFYRHCFVPPQIPAGYVTFIFKHLTTAYVDLFRRTVLVRSAGEWRILETQ